MGPTLQIKPGGPRTLRGEMDRRLLFRILGCILFTVYGKIVLLRRPPLRRYPTTTPFVWGARGNCITSALATSPSTYGDRSDGGRPFRSFLSRVGRVLLNGHRSLPGLTRDLGRKTRIGRSRLRTRPRLDTVTTVWVDSAGQKPAFSQAGSNI